MSSPSHSPPLQESLAIRLIIDGSYEDVDTQALTADILDFFPHATNISILPGFLVVFFTNTFDEPLMQSSRKFLEAERTLARTNLKALSFDIFGCGQLCLTTSEDIATFEDKYKKTKPYLALKSSYSSDSEEPNFTEILKIICAQIDRISKLTDGWNDSDEDADQEFLDRKAPSEFLCKRVLGLLVKNLDYFRTNTDLPHICPMEEYAG